MVRFSELRKERGITLQHLEYATYIPRSRLYKYECGKLHLPYYAAVRLAKFFDTSTAELFPEITGKETSRIRITSDNYNNAGTL